MGAFLEGIVVHGDGRGHELGFPTANVVPAHVDELPEDGVYAGRVGLEDGTTHVAAVSIGRRPTYYVDGALLVEAHLLDFDGDLYGQRVELEVCELVRGQLRFDSSDELIAQIGRDVKSVRAVAGAPNSAPSGTVDASMAGQ